MLNNSESVAIVILNYNTYQDTIRLVRELQRQSVVQRLRIVVVDNASPNGSYEQIKPLKQEFTNVVVLRTEVNLGYAKGNNFGLKYLEQNRPPKYVAILNNDVSLENDCLERLAKRYEELERPGVIAPIMVDRMGEQQVVMNRLPSAWEDFMSLSAIYQKLHNSKRLALCDNTGHKAMRVEVIGGSFMFTQMERFRQMGYFYPGTFLYIEERFVAEAAKKLQYYNYVILDQTYIHAHNSPSINSEYDKVSKYRMLYRSRREYIRVCKRHGRLKAAILRPFMWWSLMEWRLIGWIKRIL